MANPNCSKCHGKGFFKKQDGSVTTCFDCLLSGDMDQHDANVKDAGIKI
jgi:DnaJ-class molecular chaperone